MYNISNNKTLNPINKFTDSTPLGHADQIFIDTAPPGHADQIFIDTDVTFDINTGLPNKQGNIPVIITVTSREAKEFVYNTLVDEISGSGSLCGHKECLHKHDVLPDVLEFALTDDEMIEVEQLPGVVCVGRNIGEPELLYDKTSQTGKIKLATFNSDPDTISHSILYTQDHVLKFTDEPSVNGSTVSTLSSIDCSNVDIIVVDSGVDPDHSDFLDSNGVSRVVQFDWSLLEESLIDPQATAGSTIIDSLPSNYYRDLNGHGTACASLVAGNKSGMAKNAKIYAMNTVEADPVIPGGLVAAMKLILAFQKAKKQNLYGLDSTRPTICTNSWIISNGVSVYLGTSTNESYNDFSLSDIGFDNTAAIKNAADMLQSLGGAGNDFISYVKGRSDLVDSYFRLFLQEGIHTLVAAGNSNIFQKNEPVNTFNRTLYEQGTHYAIGNQAGSLPYASTYLPAIPELAETRDFEFISSKGGQCGNNSTKTLSAVTLIDSGIWSDISCSAFTTFGIKAGKLYSWGSNHYGLLGRSSASLGNVYARGASIDGNISGRNLIPTPANSGVTYDPLLIVNPGDSKVPTEVNNWNDWTQIAAGPYHAAGIRGGKIYSWGLGYYGATGVATTAGEQNSTERVDRLITEPTQVGTDSDWAYVACGTIHTLGLKNNGELYAWGTGEAIGYKPLTDVNLSINDWGVNTPVRVRSSTDNLDFNSYDSDWTYIFAGNSASYGIRNNGELYAWGSDSNDQLGTTGEFQSTNGGRVGAADNLLFSTVASRTGYVLGITTDGKLYQWGNVGWGNLGSGGRVGFGTILNPEQIGTETDWVDVNIRCDGIRGSGSTTTANFISSYAKKQNGNVIGWGYNNCYQIAEVPFDDPTYIQSFDQKIINIPGNCEKFAKGCHHSMFIAGDGKLYAIGSNAGGGPLYNVWFPTRAVHPNHSAEVVYSYGSPGIGLNTNVITYTKDDYPIINVGCVIPIGGNDADNDIYWTSGNGKAVYTWLSGINPNDSPVVFTDTTRYNSRTGPFFVKSGYSDFGPNVDVYAPGNGAWAAASNTISTTLDSMPTLGSSPNKFRFFNGTSSACPIAAGCLATYLSEFPTKTPAQAREWLLNNAVHGNIAEPKYSNIQINTYNLMTSAFELKDILFGPTSMSNLPRSHKSYINKYPDSAVYAVARANYRRITGGFEVLRYHCSFFQSHNRIVQAFPLRRAILSTGGENTLNINDVTLTLSNAVSEAKTHYITLTPSAGQPTYNLIINKDIVNEGQSFVVTLITTNVNDGTTVPYNITGIDSSDINESLTGNFTINNNTATATFNVAEDSVVEGIETFTLTLDNE